MEAAKYNVRDSKIYMFDASTSNGKQFIKTSFHELIHAEQFYNGSIHSKYLTFKGYGWSNAKIQAGLVYFTESWAYNSQRLRFGESNYNCSQFTNALRRLKNKNDYGFFNTLTGR